MQQTRAQVLSRWIDALEGQGCEVLAQSRGEGRVELLAPGWDRVLLPGGQDTSALQRWFCDRVVLRVDAQGGVRLRPDWFSIQQLGFHGAVAALFAWQAWFGAGTDAVGFVWALASAQLAPWVVAELDCARLRARVTREV